jgi:hypothetical protein
MMQVVIPALGPLPASRHAQVHGEEEGLLRQRHEGEPVCACVRVCMCVVACVHPRLSSTVRRIVPCCIKNTALSNNNSWNTTGQASASVARAQPRRLAHALYPPDSVRQTASIRQLHINRYVHSLVHTHAHTHTPKGNCTALTSNSRQPSSRSRPGLRIVSSRSALSCCGSPSWPKREMPRPRVGRTTLSLCVRESECECIVCVLIANMDMYT